MHDRAHRLRFRCKVWLDADRRFAVGDGGIALLRAIDETGSVRAAAQRVGWSYRHALGYLDNADAALGRALVARARGGMERGGARLTPDGRRFVRQYAAFRRRLDAVVLRLTQSTLDALDTRTAPKEPPAPPPRASRSWAAR